MIVNGLGVKLHMFYQGRMSYVDIIVHDIDTSDMQGLV